MHPKCKKTGSTEVIAMGRKDRPLRRDASNGGRQAGLAPQEGRKKRGTIGGGAKTVKTSINQTLTCQKEVTTRGHCALG